jgi:hypothetical protein
VIEISVETANSSDIISCGSIGRLIYFGVPSCSDAENQTKDSAINHCKNLDMADTCLRYGHQLKGTLLKRGGRGTVGEPYFSPITTRKIR